MDFILENLPALAAWITPLIVGLLSVPMFGKVKAGWAWIGRRSPAQQRFLVASLAAFITWLSGVLGVALPTDLSVWTPGTTEALLAAAIAFGAHAGDKKKEDPPVE